jgi:hypothetical protein
MPCEAITQALNQRGIRSARGGHWYASSVANLLARAKKCRNVPPFYKREISRLVLLGHQNADA